MIVGREARPIRVTSNGIAVSRDCLVSGLSVEPGESDVIVSLSDAKSIGNVLHQVEADNAAGSHYEAYNPPMRFRGGVHIQFDVITTGMGCTLFIVESTQTP